MSGNAAASGRYTRSICASSSSRTRSTRIVRATIPPLAAAAPDMYVRKSSVVPLRAPLDGGLRSEDRSEQGGRHETHVQDGNDRDNDARDERDTRAGSDRPERGTEHV